MGQLRTVVICALILIGCGDGGGTPPPPPTCVTGAIVCPNGFQCSLATGDCEQSNGTVRWQLTDECGDGLRIQARFFDTTHGGVWPAQAGQAWITPTEGGFVDELLACIPGATVCYGATPFPQDGGYWGLGIDGDQGCTDCCAVCGSGNPPPINLTCN